MNERDFERQAFLKTHLGEGVRSDFLASDMSPRQYFRVHHQGLSFVLMDSPPPECPAQFIRVAEYIRGLGLRSPQIFGHDKERGFVLLEDFGDHTFTKLLRENQALTGDLFLKGCEILKFIGEKARDKPPFLEDYGPERHLDEARVFIEWYNLWAKGEPFGDSCQREYIQAFEETLAELPPTPNTLVLRDFHVDNIMGLGDSENLLGWGLLDFQDALWGSYAYDVVSFLEDARFDLPADIKKTCLDYFCKGFNAQEKENFEGAYSILGVCRHFKILGVFTRYAVRGNGSKIKHLPRVWGYIREGLKHPSLHRVKAWADKYLGDI